MDCQVTSSHDDLDIVLDVLGQQPLLKIYTQITCCFSVPDDSLHAKIIETLRRGLEHAAASFPWIAGQVVNEGAREGDTGVFKIKPLAETPRLVVKDLRGSVPAHGQPKAPTMDDLRRAGFPMSMLDEELLSFHRTIPRDFCGPEEVLSVQAVFVKGGLLLTFAAAHNTMDITGQGQVISLISKACKGEAFTPEELRTGNIARGGLVELLDESYVPGPELDDQIMRPPPPPAAPTAAQPTPPPPRCLWAYLTFTGAALASLKDLAISTLPPQTSAALSTPQRPAVPFVSTDDALTALIWRSVARARLPRLGPARLMRFARAVDARPHLGIPATYPGLMQNMTYHAAPLGELTGGMSLGAVAADLRAALLLPSPQRQEEREGRQQHGQDDVAWRTRAVTTYMARSADKSRVSFTAGLDPSGADAMLSSWAKIDLHGLDFGFGLGRPEAVRRPRFDEVEGLLYLMPRDGEGGIAVAVCLREDDLERLRGDEELGRFGVYVG